jgi:hypothetical protein
MLESDYFYQHILKSMKISLIIVTYNRPEALSLILKSIEKQKVLPDEVVIADDGSGKETQETIHKFQKNFLFLCFMSGTKTKVSGQQQLETGQ